MDFGDFAWYDTDHTHTSACIEKIDCKENPAETRDFSEPEFFPKQLIALSAYRNFIPRSENCKVTVF